MSNTADSKLHQLVEHFSNESLAEFLRGRCGAFVAEGIDYSDGVIAEKFTELQQIGVIRYANAEKVQIITCKYDGALSKRAAKKAQFDQIKKILGDEYNDAAVFVFYDNDGRFRFSFIFKNWGAKGENKFSPWRRYTFFVDGATQSNRTFLERIGGCRFESIKQVEEAFAVGPLSDAFFEQYKKQYGEFCGYLTGRYWVKGRGNVWSEMNYRDHEPDLVQFHTQFGGDAKRVRDYIKKLLGRLVFLKFLERKRWLNGKADFLTQLFEGSDRKEDFLDGVLEPLFFKILNTPVEKRKMAELTPIFGEKFDIPYLNGGLFDNDGVDDMRVRFPSGHFDAIFEFFNLYNFTIDENDPNDAEVGIDPEMLGRIFENLLEDNKDKGAFYTPKEIVQYMCQESLIQYLQTHLGKSEDLADFVRTGEIKGMVRKHAPRIDELLDEVKICDPAVGSGAFPMGLLQEILRAKVELNLADSNKITEFKEHVIQNSIYGVDIEQGAVDIARLRFWLSLVVDSEVAKPLPNLDYKIMCGNSLISRYGLDMPLDDVFAEYNRDRVEADRMTLQEYRRLVDQYTDEHDGKKDLRTKIEEIKRSVKSVLYVRDTNGINAKRKRLSVLEHPTLFGEAKSKEDKADIKRLRDEIKALEQGQQDVLANKVYENAFEWRFEFPSLLDDDGKFIGFDIVIANPPYVSIEGISEANRKLLKSLFRFFYHRYDLFACFIERGLDLAKNDGNLCFIQPSVFLNSKSFKLIRAEIVSKYSIHILDLLEDGVFESAIVPTMIMQIAKQHMANTKISCSKGNFVQRYLIDQSTFLTTELNVFNMTMDRYAERFVQKTSQNCIYLGEIARVSNAINVGNHSKYIFHSSLIENDKDYIKIIKGGSISKWHYEYNHLLIKKCFDEFVSCGDKDVFRQPKLMMKRIGVFPNVCFDDTGIAAVHTIHTIRIIDKLYDPKYVMALMNSFLIGYIFRLRVPLKGKVFPEFRVFDLNKQIPIKIISQEEQQPFVDLVDQILAAKKADPLADTTAIEAQIDQMVYALYDLTPSEITLITNQNN